MINKKTLLKAINALSKNLFKNGKRVIYFEPCINTDPENRKNNLCIVTYGFNNRITVVDPENGDSWESYVDENLDDKHIEALFTRLVEMS
jgi:hypothetical protein